MCEECGARISRTAKRCRACNLRRVAQGNRVPEPLKPAERQAIYRARHREELGDKWRTERRAATLAKYGLTIADYECLWAEQDGKCAICGTSDPDHHCGTLLVDHDHETGRVRGLLCNCCNRGLGSFKYDPDRLSAAIEYLARTDVTAQIATTGFYRSSTP